MTKHKFMSTNLHDDTFFGSRRAMGVVAGLSYGMLGYVIAMAIVRMWG